MYSGKIAVPSGGRGLRCNNNNIEIIVTSLGLVYKSMRGVMTNSIDRDQWLNVTSELRDRI
jgi:hypothetical protein